MNQCTEITLTRVARLSDLKEIASFYAYYVTAGIKQRSLQSAR